MILLDSNIVIEISRSGADPLRDRLGRHSRFVSVITRVEVLGYHRLTPDDRRDLEIVLHATTEIPLDRRIVDRAVLLRQSRKSSLGDVLIAATALVHGLPLVTRNVKDFRWIDDLELIDPPPDKPGA